MPTLALPPTPKPESTAALSVAPIEAVAGETQQLHPIFEDEKGNVVSGGKVTWTILDSNAGSIDSSGMLTSGEVAGRFEGAVEARAIDGPLVSVATVTIVPGSLEQVGIAPDPVEIGIEMSQQFVAAGADKFGNRITGLEFTWKLEKAGGTLDAKGLFTAGHDSGVFSDIVKVSASDGDSIRSVTTSVTVEPDRIAFLSRRDGNPTDAHDLYIMDADGTNAKRLTTGGAFDPSWSPDGRRMIYYRNGTFRVVNDDGDWLSTLLSEIFRVENPAWSPDGTKITYQSFEHARDNEDQGGTEIYVMDVDGGNRVRLTDNSWRDDYPSWSADGGKVVFMSDSQGDEKEQIYVVDADGANLRQVTGTGDNTAPAWSHDGSQLVFGSRPGPYDYYTINLIDAAAETGAIRAITIPATGDYDPSWSGDGEEILFASYRDSTFRQASESEERLRGLDIYIMERSGKNIRCLTNNDAWDGSPHWAPRKRRLEAGDSSIVFPDASTMAAMAVKDVVSSARRAVVQIVTDRGSGSGFIIDADGIILTNNHVIQDAQEITVFLDDGTEFAGTVLGRDMIRDLAKIKIAASELPVLAFGDLSEVSQGQQVVVLGFPLGNTEISVTSGFVSNILFDPGRNVRFIQTDSAVNPGNSGGPLLDLRGRVIGVVSEKEKRVDVEGIGRAISANTVKVYLDRLEEREIVDPQEAGQAATESTGTVLRDLPSGSIALDSSGDVYVADTGNHRVQKFDKNGRFLAEWGSLGSRNGQFDSPSGIAVGGVFVYVADTGNHRVQKFDKSGRFASKWGAKGILDGEFDSPTGIALDDSGNLYVADSGNHRVQKFDSLGRFAIQWGSLGSRDGQFRSPNGIVVDGSVYVADTGNHRVQRFTTGGGFMLKLGTKGSSDGQFDSP
ncbi:MAG: hypothetical protein CMJ45_10045, partial [Planctomyces sp.]|nr:hypothetical protein [Planctomyces sp.]